MTRRFSWPSTTRVSGNHAPALSSFTRCWQRHHIAITRTVDPVGVSTGQNGGHMERGTIVVVDDEPNIADLVGMYLEREGYRVRQAAYLESDTPHGQSFTGRRYSNDEVYQSGGRQRQLRHGKKRMEGIVHYVRMRHDSARAQLKRLRRTMPRTIDGFAPAADQLRRAA